MSLLKVISTNYTSLLSNFIGPICRHKPQFVVVPSRQMKGIGEDKRFDLCTALLCNNCPTLLYLHHFVIHTSLCSSDYPLCSKLRTPFSTPFSTLAPFCNSAKLPYFVMIYARLCKVGYTL